MSTASGRLISLKLFFSAVDRLIYNDPSFSSKIAESHLIIGRSLDVTLSCLSIIEMTFASAPPSFTSPISQLLCRSSAVSQLYYVNVRVSLSLSFAHLLSPSKFMTYLNFNACVYKYTCSMCSGNAAVQDAPKITSTEAMNCFWTPGT